MVNMADRFGAPAVAALAEWLYTELEWSGCAGSSWDRLGSDTAARWQAIAAGILKDPEGGEAVRPEFRVTFGQQYRRDPHPRAGTLVHPDGWWTIVADDHHQARDITAQLLGTAWSNLYDADLHADDEHFYPRGELLRVVAPPAAG